MTPAENMYLSEPEKAYEIIHDAIMTGKFCPGTKLSRRKMAEITGTSVIPVIEALKRLESEGLVESRPKWGSFVIVPSKERLDNQYILRETIECKVVQLLTEKGLNPEQEARLRACARNADLEQFPANWQGRHYEFHLLLAEYTGYSSFTDVLKRINFFSILCRALNARRRHSHVPSDWHERIVDAIVSGDSTNAQKLMKDHIFDSYSFILKEINEFNDNWKQTQAIEENLGKAKRE